jgi:hypothetical protein
MSPISTFLLSLAISRNGARASLQPRRCAIRAAGAEVQLNKRDFGFGGDSIPSVSGGCGESPTLRSRRQRHREVRTGIFPLIAAATQ